MGGGIRSGNGEGLSWAPVAELPLPPLRYTNCSFATSSPEGWSQPVKKMQNCCFH